MLLFEAKREIDSRLTEQLKRDYQSMIPEYFEALEIASNCIDAQMRLCDLLNDLYPDLENEVHENDTYSLRLVIELLETCLHTWRDENEQPKN